MSCQCSVESTNLDTAIVFSQQTNQLTNLPGYFIGLRRQIYQMKASIIFTLHLPFWTQSDRFLQFSTFAE